MQRVFLRHNQHQYLSAKCVANLAELHACQSQRVRAPYCKAASKQLEQICIRLPSHRERLFDVPPQSQRDCPLQFLGRRCDSVASRLGCFADLCHDFMSPAQDSFESHADRDAVLISAMTAGPRQEMQLCSQQTRQHQPSNSRLRKASERIPLAHLPKSGRC